MIPVMQNRFEAEGNCLPACVVSILNTPDALDEVTEVLSGNEGWQEQHIILVRWLRIKGMTCLPLLFWDMQCEEFIRGVTCIASGISPRNWGHCVVWRDGLLHDPHPDGGGLVEVPTTFIVIVPLVIPFPPPTG